MNQMPIELRSHAVVTPTWQEIVDGCWDDFVAALPERMRDDARRLPLTLRLTPKPLPWSRIFHQEVTLALPFTLAEALPASSPARVRIAVTAHMLGIVAAFGADRLDDGQVEAAPALLDLLAEVRRAREAAIEALGVRGSGPLYDYRAADAATADGNRTEQAFLARHEGADLATYERFSLPKQFLVFPATMSFARAAGLGAAALAQVETMCLAMAMGLQLRDDATDWEDDHAEGRSWAERLLRRAESGSDHLADLPALRVRMAEAGVIVGLLDGAARHFEVARAAAATLSAHRVAAWSERQGALTSELAQREREEPGHIVRWERARKQARWS